MKLKSFWINNAVHIISALSILMIFHIVGKTIENSIYKHNINKQQDVIIIALVHITYFVIMSIAMIVILRIFGMEITGIVAIITMLGFAIGLSLQGSLSDIASGILLTFFKIFSIGDVIQIGETEGTVLDFKLIHTVIEDQNTKSITTIPNRRLQDTIVSNITRQGYHYFIIDFLISNKDHHTWKIREHIIAALKDTKKFPDVIQTMPHRVSILDMSNVGTKWRIRIPVNTTGDIAVKRGDIRLALRATLEEHGIILIDPSAIVAGK